ncbi:AEC family transporter [Suttonella ornithocola]|uniref:Auxin efflux carrier n=1 Tax=Suttonella ornithocola TaxID=279832 RepID=A0A380MN91_9GAMM|nr:AEC family transporter [Suttonella ornithocola]SUO94095.1 auxin efflux carrier [Suttonella ornithocola]
MSEFFASLQFAIIVTLPNILLPMLGIYLRRRGQVTVEFCTQATHLVFTYGLPLLLFTNLVENDIHYGEQARLLTAGIVCTLVLYIGAEIYAYRYIPAVKDKGVFVQGVFRSNMAILGLAFIQNAYGNAGLAGGAVYMGVVTILYNILAVITLSREENNRGKLTQIGKKILSNPLIIAIVFALILQRLQLHPPQVLMKTARILAGISLPLALICAGATFTLSELRTAGGLTVKASFARLIIAPFIVVMIGLLFGLRGIPMGILFLMNASSAAASGYVMARAMDANHVAAANILALTTVGSGFTAAAGIVILHALGWM